MTGVALIVDDDGVWRDTLARAVDRLRIKHDSAATAQRAIELIRKKKYSIGLLDADLGNEQGAYGCSEVLAELKANGNEPPVVIVSGAENVQQLSKDLARHYSKLSHFTKGESLLELERVIRDALGARPDPDETRGMDMGDLVEFVDYEFAFLKLDIVGHSAIYNTNRSPDIDQTLETFEKLVESEVRNFQGHILSWQGDGGLIVFVAGDKSANCIEAALAILYSLRKFNDNQNKTKEDVQLRLACHRGVAKYKSNHGRIHSAAINYVCHLEAKGTRVNAISISDAFYRELPERVKARFSAKGTFEGAGVYEYVMQVP
jgi:class 3 adenylate cyclase